MNKPQLRRISWWKLALGLLLAYLGIKNLDHRNIQPDLVPSNESQWIGYYLITAVFLIAGLLFIFFAVRNIWRNRPSS